MNEKILPLGTKICKMYQPMGCLECIFSILLLADLDSMSLGYLHILVMLNIQNCFFRKVGDLKNFHEFHL